MRTLFTLIGLLTSILVMGQTKNVEESAIRELFKNVRTAILDEDGSNTASMVDSTTLAYYDSLSFKLLYFDSTQLANEPETELLNIFKIKHKAGVDTLQKMKGPQILRFAIDNNMIPKGTLESVELGSLNIQDQTALGAFKIQGQELPVNFEFIKESGGWKFSLYNLLNNPMITQGDSNQQSKLDISREQYLTDVLYYTSGMWPNFQELWNPIIKNKTE